MKHYINIEKYTIDQQCPELTDIFIYLDFIKQTIQMYCSNPQNEELKIKLNLIKLAINNRFVKNTKDFWNRIKDVKIKLNKEKTFYELEYEFE